VIDFIDMERPENRERLQGALYEELRKDRSRTRPLAISDFGLVQLTRKRTRRSLDKTLQLACPACGGSGRIRSALAVYYQVQRALARGWPLAGPDGPTVRLHPATIARLSEEGLRLRGPGGEEAAAPRLVPDPALSEERFEIVW
jgi:ribonuclease G